MGNRKSLTNTLKVAVVLIVWLASFIAYDLYLQNRIARRIVRLIRRTPLQ